MIRSAAFVHSNCFIWVLAYNSICRLTCAKLQTCRKCEELSIIYSPSCCLVLDIQSDLQSSQSQYLSSAGIIAGTYCIVCYPCEREHRVIWDVIPTSCENVSFQVLADFWEELRRARCWAASLRAPWAQGAVQHSFPGEICNFDLNNFFFFP